MPGDLLHRPGAFRSWTSNPVEVRQFACRGPPAVVGIWRDLVFLPVVSQMVAPKCGAARAGALQPGGRRAFEGIRIVWFADRANPCASSLLSTRIPSRRHPPAGVADATHWRPTRIQKKRHLR
ncbi:MAG TPA: hypothetical protein VM344_06055 [Vitreimonas sp.]|nr:hypothetical protein [Vitreimonas sp.]